MPSAGPTSIWHAFHNFVVFLLWARMLFGWMHFHEFNVCVTVRVVIYGRLVKDFGCVCCLLGKH